MVSNSMLSKLSEDLNLNRQVNVADVGELNLTCAFGLPGADNLDIDDCLRRLDEIAVDVGRIIFLADNYAQFLENPDRFRNSQAYFAVVCMVSVLRTKYGVHYNPQWQHITPESGVPLDFCRSAKDQHIHAILDGTGGTCGSLPVFFTAIGRRLGFPLKLVKAHRHLFIRWDDPDGSWLHSDKAFGAIHGEVFNIEATGAGIHCITDEDYASRWPKPIPQEYLDAGIFLRSLTPEEELAEFLAARACCLIRNGRYKSAVESLQWSCQLAPHNTLRKQELVLLRAHLAAIRRGPFINQPMVTPFSQSQPPRPRWIEQSDGSRMLVQFLNTQSMAPPPMGRNPELVLQTVELPNGPSVWAEVPIQTGFRPMVAYWIEISPAEYALVHRPMTAMQQAMSPYAVHNVGQPVVPSSPRNQYAMPPAHQGYGLGHHEPPQLTPWDEQELRRQVMTLRHETQGIPQPHYEAPQPLAPSIGCVPTPALLPRTPVSPTPFAQLTMN